MKKLFYFSKASLKYVEIKNFKLKLFSLLLVLSLLFTTLFLTINYFLGIYSSPEYRISSLRNENRELKEEIKRIAESYKELANDVDNISEIKYKHNVCIPPLCKIFVPYNKGRCGEENYENVY